MGGAFRIVYVKWWDFIGGIFSLIAPKRRFWGRFLRVFGQFKGA